MKNNKFFNVCKIFFVVLVLTFLFFWGIYTIVDLSRTVDLWKEDLIQYPSVMPNNFTEYAQKYNGNNIFFWWFIGFFCFFGSLTSTILYIVYICKKNYKIIKKEKQNSKESEQNNQDQVNN